MDGFNGLLSDKAEHLTEQKRGDKALIEVSKITDGRVLWLTSLGKALPPAYFSTPSKEHLLHPPAGEACRLP